MSDDPRKTDPQAPEKDVENVENVTEGHDAAATEEPDLASPESPESLEIAQLMAENAKLKDSYLRLAADMENLRRRTDREIRDAKSYSIAGFARDMLTVSDNLRRAIDSVPEQAEGAVDTGLKALMEGVDLTERSMLTTLERHGVRKIEPKGQKFDPNFHQAMFELPNPDVPNNMVMEVVQPGFVIGERVLRPAMVGVAKGGPREMVHPAEPGPPNAEAEKDA